MHPSYMVSGLNAMDKTAMCEMPLLYVFGDWVLGLGRAFFVLVFWAMAFCHWSFVPRSSYINVATFVSMQPIYPKKMLSLIFLRRFCIDLLYILH